MAGKSPGSAGSTQAGEGGRHATERGRKTLEGLSINLATTRQQWGFRDAVEGCLRHGIRAIAPWRDQLAAIGVAEAARIVRDEGLRVTGLCRGGFFPAADAAGRQAAIDDNHRAIEDAAALGADCLVLVTGGLPPGSRDLAGARTMVADGVAAILPLARAARVPLALEPLHPMYAADRSCLNTLAQALDLCDALDPARTGAIGIAFDVYHCWWDPQLEVQLLRAGPQRLLAHHICDWLVPTRDLLTDRGMMGDGVIDLKGVRRIVEAAGFSGPQEVEIFSAGNWWKKSGDEVLEVCVERFLELCRSGHAVASPP
jgi:sugar phosphate isomerase/epimerase